MKKNLAEKLSVRRILIFALVFFAAVILWNTVLFPENGDYKYIGFFPGKGIRAYDGDSWRDYSDGLPSGFEAVYIISDSKGNLYLTTEYSGIFRRCNNDSKWRDISSFMFKRRTQLEGVDEYRNISSFCIDPADESRLYLGTKHTLYVSHDSGASWNRINILNNKNSYYYTSLAVVNGVLFAGTSFNGVLKIINGRVDELIDGVPKEYYVGPFHFCEGVSALAEGNGVLYSGYLFGRGVVESADHRKWNPVNASFSKTPTESVYGIVPLKDKLFISSDETVYEYDLKNKKLSVSGLQRELEESYERKGPAMLFVRASEKNPALFVKRNTAVYDIEKNTDAGERRAVYVNWGMIDNNFMGFLELVERNKFNAVIIDVKDDFGVINAPVDSQTAREIGAIKNTNIMDIIKALHDKDIWVVARNVTFKDKKLYEAYSGKYAILDKVTGKPWVGLPRERWCDPYSKFVRDYNIEIARETAKLGFDEIQFDYIRFPTDGLTGRCRFRYREKDDTFKSEIMGDFLQQARKEAGVPVSVDIYGFNAWYRFGNIIGQDIQFLSRFVDVICPMIYPSHFCADFYSRYPVAEKPYHIVKDSIIRSIYLSNKRVVIRGWIQDFNYLSPTWGPDYILKQIKGVDDGGAYSWSLWNPAGDHSMSDRALSGKK
ncbi:MAG TPA: putative glycoside hydrolase [Spirochaetota bacterium]|nr:putative glycoside hydrolase [Spirochaetota bacterium]